ncbi:hypothetical protein ACHAWF_005509 [Thalassiosira exigua]
MVDLSLSWEANFPSHEHNYDFSPEEEDLLASAQRLDEELDKDINSERERALRAAVYSIPFDENSPHVRVDCLMQELIKCWDLATEYDLFELKAWLSEMLQALNGDTPAHLECQRRIFATICNSTKIDDVESWNGKKLRKECSLHVSMLRSAFETGHDGRSCRRDFILLIGPIGRFDIQHMAHMTQERMLKKVKKGSSATLEQEFEAGDPLSALRNEENGYPLALTKANDCVSAGEADALAKKAFEEKRLWTAELWWEKAITLDQSNAKYYSNLATLYIKIGRYLRSMEIGYRGLATRYIENAVASAKKGIVVDPSWERSYERGSQAYFALGPYERAIDALKLLKPAFGKDCTLIPSEKLKALHFKAKTNARAWLSLRVIPGRTTIPEAIESALENLRKVIIQSFPLCFRTDKILPPSEGLAKAGDDIVDALNVTLGTLQLMYTKRLDWEVQYSRSNVLKTGFQIQLREAAKVVPLQVLMHNERLQKMAFAEDPVFSFWGMDRCDRLNVEVLPFCAEDPCERDGEGSEELDEILHRGTDCPGVMQDQVTATEIVYGKKAMSFDRDMANHHLCAFTMTLLERLLLSDHYPDLRLKATKRAIELTLNPNALNMGGDFIGKVTKAASGFDAFNSEAKDTSKFFNFIGLKGGLSTIAREVCSGGDLTENYQKLLCKLTPQHLSSQSESDIICLFYEYALCSLDGHYACLNHEQISEYVKVVISNVMKSDTSFENTIVPCLVKSAFGQYLFRKWSKVCGRYPEPSYETLGKAIEFATELSNSVPAAVDKWGKMSKKIKSTHRWNSMSPTQQERLTSLKPISKVEKFEKNLREKDGDEKEEFSLEVKELPECHLCKCIVNLKVCQCNLVYYCGRECQTRHWKEHKAIHKKALKCITVS